MLQVTTIKGEGQVKGLTEIESDSQQFTPLEQGLLEGSVVCFGKAEIAVKKCAVDKLEVHEVKFRKITFGEFAMIIFTNIEATLAKRKVVELAIGNQILHVYLAFRNDTAAGAFQQGSLS